MIFFGFFFQKNIEQSRKRWKMMETGQILMENEEMIFFGFFSEKYRKMSKKVKNDENGSDFDEKGHNWWKMKEKITFFLFFQKEIWKNVETMKNDEKCSDIIGKGKYWWNMNKKFGFFQQNITKCRKKVKNDENV